LVGYALTRRGDTIQTVIEAQEERWGAPLLNHATYARRPSIFRAVRGMWPGIEGSGLIDARLQALVNRRVAALSRCAVRQDSNAAVGRSLGVSEEKNRTLAD
jgi:hypothetical protein